MKVLLSFLASAALSITVYSQALYNINFQTPDQGVNQIVQTGASPDHVSTILFGTPTVVSAFGPLTDQPLLFDSNNELPSGPFYYTQIGLTFPNEPLTSVDLSFDMVDTGSGHEFTVLFDTPSVRNFYFDNGQISFFSPSLGDVNVGTYQMGDAYHFDIHVDYLLNQWSFLEDNTVLGTGAFNPDGDTLQSIRMNYSASGPNISGTAIDNLLVVVPEPSSLSILALASGTFAFIRFSGRKS
jgi:hypothetical protein